MSAPAPIVAPTVKSSSNDSPAGRFSLYILRSIASCAREASTSWVPSIDPVFSADVIASLTPSICSGLMSFLDSLLSKRFTVISSVAPTPAPNMIAASSSASDTSIPACLAASILCACSPAPVPTANAPVLAALAAAAPLPARPSSFTNPAGPKNDAKDPTPSPSFVDQRS